jgi:RNA polymerase sigma-70 factor (ECF subfamily)
MSVQPDLATSTNLLRELASPAGGEQAWRRFFARYSTLIYGWCRRSGLQDADAEDVRAEVLAKLAKAMTTFAYSPHCRFRGWLRVVVGNAVADFWRRRQRHPGDQGTGSPEGTRALEELSDPGAVGGLVEDLDRELTADLDRARGLALRVQQRVTPRTWEAFRLHVMEGRPGPDVAQVLGMTVTAVHVAVRRARTMLREEAAWEARGTP